MSYQPATTKLRPSGLWYLIGALAIAGGIVAFVASIIIGGARMSDTVDNFTRFSVGTDGVVATVDFARPGTYTLYYEYPPGADDARQELPTDLAVTITGIDDKAVPFTAGGDEASFSIGKSKRAGRSAGEFTLPVAGKYDIQVTGGKAVAPYEMAVGKGVLASFGKTVLLGALVGAVLGLVGLVLLIVTGVKRKRAKRIAGARAAAWTPGGSDGVVSPPYPPTVVPGPPSWTPEVPAAAPPAYAPPAPAAAPPAYAPAAAPLPPAVPPAPAPVAAPLAPPPAAPLPPAPPLPPVAPPTPPAPAPPLPPPAYDPAPTAAPTRSPWDPPASPPN